MVEEKKEKEKICNHNPNDLGNTLRRLDKIKMTFPRVDEYICKVCHEFFEF